MSETADPLDFLADHDVVIAWTSEMPNAAVWVSQVRIMVLNSQCDRVELSEAARSMIERPTPNPIA